MNTFDEMLSEDLLANDEWALLLKDAMRQSKRWLRKPLDIFEAADIFQEKYLELRGRDMSDEEVFVEMRKSLPTIIRHKMTDLWRRHVRPTKANIRNK